MHFEYKTECGDTVQKVLKVTSSYLTFGKMADIPPKTCLCSSIKNAEANLYEIVSFVPHTSFGIPVRFPLPLSWALPLLLLSYRPTLSPSSLSGALPG